MKRLIDELRLQLGDIDGTGYPDALLVEFINDAMCQIAQLRPERFARPMVIKAQKGEVQCIKGCCTSLLSVDGVVDKNGNPLGRVNKGSTDLAKAFDKKPMASAKTSYTFSMREDAETFFEVDPPIKPSDDVYFRITCVAKPEPLGIDDTFDNCMYHELIINYALYRAYYVESESQTSIAMGDRYLKLFHELIKANRKVDKENDDS